ncbi:type II secretion system protein E [Halorubrum distributum JCM 9100]|uniref:Type II secretion system protein E n=4 Tax=Halorubrum distributum TaxID=29283 RepID=M0EMP2_9EURY|nr:MULTISPECIES: type II/IV secretion system ATPase subunit [Halorubrum distributum group]PHQ44625.1 type II secretion system protein [Halorubrum sp. C3]ELZ27874.1 type II secretion system protein E [Halorubrum terrestre JCM 10247]ELZ47684.1 type II secretion system protein E [Halorubrum distributum JCM 9100]ELZ52751.1 type II secretion system protein E [Halorubrum distributum JCM 10118]EMA62591.1 type II secretion system protein E [Halorubrum litoreum JCM 13561]
MASDAGGSDLGDRIEDLQRRLSRTWELLQGSTLDVRPFSPGEDGPLASFVVPEDEREVDRYWVNAPYAYVVITYDEVESEHRYYAVEPELDAFERGLLDRIVDDIRDPLLYREGTGKTDEETLKTELVTLLEGYGVEAGMDTFHALAYYLYRDFRGYGKVDPLLNDRHIEDVSCDGYDLPIFVYHDQYTDIETNVSFGQEALDSYVIRLAQQSGRHVSVGDPIVETTLPDGSRAELALGEEVTPRGSAFTIRQYAEDPFTPVDLVEYGTFSVEQMAYFWLCIEHNKSLIFAGGTASGKTTSMNAVSMFVPPRAKVLTIEDTRELSLYHDNWLSAVTRERRYEGTDIDMYDLLRSALRHRPEYIIVGEVRGEEAITLFQAMNTGHTTFSTMHADSIETVINRLENEPINVPRAMVQSLDMLSVQTLTRSDDERVRRAKTIGEIGGIDQRTGELDYSSAFEWVPDTDSFRRNDSSLLEEIADERGWSRSELLREVRRRERFIELLSALGIDDYRTFTALVNEYYADADRVMEKLDDRAAAADGVDPDDLADETDAVAAGDGADRGPGAADGVDPDAADR